MLPIPLDIPLGQSKVSQEYFVAGLVEANVNVGRKYIPVNEVAVVDVLNA